MKISDTSSHSNGINYNRKKIMSQVPESGKTNYLVVELGILVGLTPGVNVRKGFFSSSLRVDKLSYIRGILTEGKAEYN